MLSSFEKGVPILEQELINKGINKDKINELVSNDELRKYDLVDGIYYINNPISFLDFKSDTVIVPCQVVNKLYIGDDFSLGFYYKDTLLNKLGLSCQVPNVLDILSSVIDDDIILNLDGMIFYIYSFRKKFGSDYDRSNLYNYITTLIDNEYMSLLDVSKSEYERLKESWDYLR